MLKTFLTVIAFTLAFAGSAKAAEPTDSLVFIFHIEINKNDQASLQNAEITKGESSAYPKSSFDDYTLTLLTAHNQIIYQTPVDVTFPIISTSSAPGHDHINLDKVIETYRLPLNYLAKTLTLTHHGKTILSADVITATCQQSAADGVCLEFCQSRGLDPDCFQCGNGFCDPNETYNSCPVDCNALETALVSRPKSSASTPWVISIGALVVIGLDSLIIRTRRGK